MEVIGFPFVEIEMEPEWRTDSVIEIASEMFESGEFSRMAELSESLALAGCDDRRILAHCRRHTGHHRGCWVVDLILEKEPNPFKQVATWDFHVDHLQIPSDLLKDRLRAFGTESSFDPADSNATLDFADWLENQGDTAWSSYVRVSSRLDGLAPDADYIDLLEERSDSIANRYQPLNIEFDNLHFHENWEASDEWWTSNPYHYYRGLPGTVHAVCPGDDSAGPPATLVDRLRSVMENTPVRGVDFEEHYADEMHEVFGSDGMSRLKMLSFENRGRKGKPSPIFNALKSATFLGSLEYLAINNGSLSDADGQTLSEVCFEKLRRLDLEHEKINCTTSTAKRLMETPWFRQLEQLSCGFGDECADIAVRHLHHMDRLHSLALFRLPGAAIRGLGNGGGGNAPNLESLRRLALMQTELKGQNGVDFCELQAPNLIDLSIIGCGMKQADLKHLFSSSLIDSLESLCLAEAVLNEKSLGFLSKSRCASRLRILRLDCGSSSSKGGFRSLGDSPLAGAAFPCLTTLEISNPYGSKIEAGATAKMLREISCNKLRRLSLSGCMFDDECAAAIESNASFSNLTRIEVRQGYGSEKLLSGRAAEKLFKASHLHKLIELTMGQAALGDSLRILADPTVLPNLKKASFFGAGASDKTRTLLAKKRPEIYL